MEKPEEEKTSEEVETKDGGVEVSIEEEKPQEEAKAEVKEEKPKAKAEPDASFRNKVYAQDRIISKLQKEIEELKTKPSEPETKPTELDEIDKLAQVDWKAAVKKLSAEEIKNVLAQERKILAEQSQQIETAQLMDRNAESVISKHPELTDEVSEKRQIFNKILDINPRWRTTPDGPLLTMYAMEDELRKLGYDLGEQKTKKEDEQNRLMRVSASSLPASKEVPSAGKVILTREQREFCDNNGMSYADYARTLSKSGDKMGVEV